MSIGFNVAFEQYLKKTGWQGLDATNAVESFARFCEKESSDGKPTVKETYNARIWYEADTGKCEYSKDGFATVGDATMWVANRFAYLMKNWGTIGEFSFAAHAEVYNNDIAYCDFYELACGGLQ